MTEQWFERALPLLEANLGDELVALDPIGGLCFGFNDVAATVWRRLEQPLSRSDLLKSLHETYDVDDRTCASDVDQLLADMIERGLIRRTEAQG